MAIPHRGSGDCYVVILADRGEYILLWTAYYVEKEHRRRKMEKEFKANQIAPK